MAFKIKPPFPIDNTPVYHVPLEEGVLGKADKNGSILINKDVESPLQEQDIINHEMVLYLHYQVILLVKIQQYTTLKLMDVHFSKATNLMRHPPATLR